MPDDEENPLMISEEQFDALEEWVVRNSQAKPQNEEDQPEDLAPPVTIH